MRIVTLTFNPAFDVHCACRTFSAERENRAAVLSREAGGKGVNVSRALLACGVTSEPFVLLGSENGGEFLSALGAGGLTCLTLSVPGRIRENITIHPETGRETRLSFPGFAVDPGRDIAAETAELLGEIPAGSAVTLTGSLPEGMPLGPVKRFLIGLRARGVLTVVDSGAFTAADLAECRPWLIKPNGEEICRYLGRGTGELGDIAGWARAMHRAGIANVVVSLGGEGAILVSDGGEFRAVPPAVQAVSTIGAGDSAIAGFLWGAALGEGAGDRLKRAVACGSAACMTPGTRPPRPEDVADLLGRVALERIK